MFNVQRTRKSKMTSEETTETSNMCQQNDCSTSSDEATLVQSLQEKIQNLERELASIRNKLLVTVDDCWLKENPGDCIEEFDPAILSDEEGDQHEDLSKLPPPPRFPNPRDSTFRSLQFPMWISNFLLAAHNIVGRLKGSRQKKTSSLSWWISLINSELNLQDLHRIIHQPYRGIKMFLHEVKQTFGYSQDRHERYLRSRIMSFDGVLDGELLSQTWQRFKTAYREANRRRLLTAGDKRDLLEKVRSVCNQCTPLQERVGVLLRYDFINHDGDIIPSENSITFERLACIVDTAISELEGERGIQLRRNHSERRPGPPRPPQAAVKDNVSAPPTHSEERRRFPYTGPQKRPYREAPQTFKIRRHENEEY